MSESEIKFIKYLSMMRANNRTLSTNKLQTTLTKKFKFLMMQTTNIPFGLYHLFL